MNDIPIQFRITPTHSDAIERNYSVLQRCTDVNLYVVDCLRAEEVLDSDQESDLEAERSSRKRINLLYRWLKESIDVSKYQSFLRVMERVEIGQQHVANLLRGNTEGDSVPLSAARYTRLIKIREKLTQAIYGLNIDTELLHLLKGSRAISDTDFERIESHKIGFERGHLLVSAIMRRSNEAFDLFKQALIDTQQRHLARYLDEGEITVVHVNTTRPEVDQELSNAFNQALSVKSELFAPLNGFNIFPIVAQPGNSIEVLIYCELVDNMDKLVEILISGQLEQILGSIFYQLQLHIRPKPKKTDEFNTRISIDATELFILEELTGMDGFVKDYSKLRKRRPKVVNNATTQCQIGDFTVKDKQLREHRRVEAENTELYRACFELLRIQNSFVADTKIKERFRHIVGKIETYSQAQKSAKNMQAGWLGLLQSIRGDMAMLRLIQGPPVYEKDLKTLVGSLGLYGRSTELSGGFRYSNAYNSPSEAYSYQQFPAGRRFLTQSPLKHSYDVYQDTLHPINPTMELGLLPYYRTKDSDSVSIMSETSVDDVDSQFSEENDDFWKDSFNRHHDFIVERMSPNFGLIGKLYSNNVLTQREKKKIRADTKIQRRNRIIMECVNQKDAHRNLVEILDQSDQSHLTNYLKFDGKYKSEFGEEWPLSEKEFSILDSYFLFLVEKLDTKEIGRLYEAKVINKIQLDFISSKTNVYDKNQALLEILRRGSKFSYRNTVRWLRATNQGHIAELLEKGEVEPTCTEGVHAHTEPADEETEDEDEAIKKVAKAMQML